MQKEIIKKLLDLQGFILLRIRVIADRVFLWIVPKRRRFICPYCSQMSCVYYDKREVMVEDLPIRDKRTFIYLFRYRFYCRTCSKVVMSDSDIVVPYHRYTKRYEEYISYLCQKMTIKDVADLTGLRWNTIKEIDKSYLKKTFSNISFSDLEVMCIDEIAYKKHHKYFTIISDPKRGRVIHIIEGRGFKAIGEFFESLDNQVRKNIKLVTIDMWKAYKKAVRRYLPNAEIVYDKFHIIKHLNESIDMVRKTEQAKLEKEGNKVFKHSRWVLLKAQENLNDKQKETLHKLCKQNNTLYKVYLLKEEFRQLFTYHDPSIAKRLLKNWLTKVKESNIKPLIQFSRMVLRWYKGIINIFLFKVSNSFAEGLNNKIATIKKTAYGYRDIEYFKLKIYQKC